MKSMNSISMRVVTLQMHEHDHQKQAQISFACFVIPKKRRQEDTL